MKMPSQKKIALIRNKQNTTNLDSKCKLLDESLLGRQQLHHHFAVFIYKRKKNIMIKKLILSHDNWFIFLFFICRREESRGDTRC